MILYHYSINKYETLKSLIAQRMPKKSQSNGDEFAYDRSLSFFLEPIPLDIAEIYFHRHEFWKSGLELYQYQIHLNALPKNIAFVLTETPKKTRLLYTVQDWDKVKTDPSLKDVYVKQIHEMEVKSGYRGHGINNLVIACKPFLHGIRKNMVYAAKLATQYPDDGGFEKYAACVPHLMVYPGYKEVSYTKVEKIKLK